MVLYYLHAVALKNSVTTRFAVIFALITQYKSVNTRVSATSFIFLLVIYKFIALGFRFEAEKRESTTLILNAFESSTAACHVNTIILIGRLMFACNFSGCQCLYRCSIESAYFNFVSHRNINNCRRISGTKRDVKK